jgi:uncharacterized membrane protein YfcA
MSLLLASLATLLAATVQSGTGFGFALVLGPAMVALLTPGQAIAAVLVLGLELNLLVLFAERRERFIASDVLRPILLWAPPGLVAGAFVVRAVSKGALQLMVGLAVLLAVAAQLGSVNLRGQDERPPSAAGAPVVGLITGVLTTATSVSGAVLVLWLHRLGVGGARLRDTLSATFLWLNIAGAVTLALVPGTHARAGHVSWLIALVPAVAIGHFAGRLIFERLSLRQHQTVVLTFVVLAGAVSLIGGAVRLL